MNPLDVMRAGGPSAEQWYALVTSIGPTAAALLLVILVAGWFMRRDFSRGLTRESILVDVLRETTEARVKVAESNVMLSGAVMGLQVVIKDTQTQQQRDSDRRDHDLRDAIEQMRR